MVTNCTKSNALNYSMVFWDSVYQKVTKEFPDIKTDMALVDATTMWFVKNPEHFDVVVASNLFGDILSDEAAVLAGSIGMLPSASLGAHGFLFEPVHGSAPDIAGQGKANPLATILSVALMFRYAFSMKKAAELIEQAVTQTLEIGFRTSDIPTEGARFVGTEAMGECVLEQIESISRDGR
jgi:3-isopropylmalate dehydrogenase